MKPAVGTPDTETYVALEQNDKLWVWESRKETAKQNKTQRSTIELEFSKEQVFSNPLRPHSLACLPFGLFIIYKHLQMVRKQKQKHPWFKGGILSEAETESSVCTHWIRWIRMQEAGNCLWRFELYQVLTSNTEGSAKLQLNSLKDVGFYVFIHRFPGWLGWRQQYAKESTQSSL